MSLAQPLAVPHHLATVHPVAIQMTRETVHGWGAPVLVLDTATSGSWSAMVAGLEPGHNPDARFDLLGHPGADLGGVTAVATTYVVRLDEGDLDHLVSQVHHARARGGGP
jgi:hypothetical protein